MKSFQKDTLEILCAKKTGFYFTYASLHDNLITIMDARWFIIITEAAAAAGGDLGCSVVVVMMNGPPTSFWNWG